MTLTRLAGGPVIEITASKPTWSHVRGRLVLKSLPGANLSGLEGFREKKPFSLSSVRLHTNHGKIDHPLNKAC